MANLTAADVLKSLPLALKMYVTIVAVVSFLPVVDLEGVDLQAVANTNNASAMYFI